MDSTAQKILAPLKSKKYAPVYVLQGEETYYIDLIANYIEANVLSESEKSFNQVILYGRDVMVHQILAHAKRYPMMSEYQVVIVREAQEIQDLQKEDGSKLLLDYLTRPVPSTILVLCHKHKTIDKRRELGKKVDQLTVSATFKKSYDDKLAPFIMDYFNDKKFEIEDQAAVLLAEYVGNDLNRLANEMDKVLIGCKPGEKITQDKIMSQVGISREYNIFELQKAIIRKDKYQAAKIVNYFEANSKRSPMIPLVAFLYSFFSKMLIAQQAPDKGPQGIVNALKISPFAARDYSSALNNYPMHKVIEIISSLKTADLKLKGVDSGYETDGSILRELVFRMMS